MEINWTEIAMPVLVALLTAAAGLVGVAIKQVSVKVKAWLETKINKEQYEKALEVANGIYIALEDKYADEVGKYGEQKMREMLDQLQKLFPSLTYEELVSINKQVWLSFQSGFDGTYDRSQSKSITDSTESTTERLDG